MHERLIEVFKKIRYNVFPGGGIDFDLATQFTEFALNDIVDKLLENGVIVLPCKVGQTVYVVDKILNVWWQGEVDCVYCNKNSFEYGILFDNDEYGACNEEDVFFTKEEAEAKLKGETK